jgi:hypothetical protein
MQLSLERRSFLSEIYRFETKFIRSAPLLSSQKEEFLFKLRVAISWDYHLWCRKVPATDCTACRSNPNVTVKNYFSSAYLLYNSTIVKLTRRDVFLSIFNYHGSQSLFVCPYFV